jgi:exo-beta-1,3-glucanase (GH17 family)
MSFDAIVVMMRRYTMAFAVAATACGAAWAQDARPAAVSGSQLLVNGKPFRIHGITYADKPKEEDFKKMADLGVNAMRTWGTGDTTQALLDMAQKYGIKVLLGIWMRHGRPGAEADDSFDWINDEKGRQAQFDSAIAAVTKYKDHPAVLGWGVGNEVTLNIATEPEKEAYAKYLEKICRAIKELDPNHPVASVSAWTTDIPYWQKFCPSIEMYGINVYGYGVFAIPGELKKLGVTKPFFLGEFGATGEWELKPDANGVRPEPGDQQKYEIFANGWANVEKESGDQFAGGFLFNFGNHLSFAGIWLDFFINDAFRPGYWGARKAFTGKDPVNRPPKIIGFLLRDSDKPHKVGEWVDAKLRFEDAENDQTTVSFYYNIREGERAHRDAVKELKSEPGDKPGFYRVQLPAEPGPTKVYAFVRDTFPNLSIAHTSIRVER